MSVKRERKPVTVTLDRRTVEMLDQYASELHLTRSAFIDLMVTQIDQVLRVRSEESDSGQPQGEI